MRAIVLFFLTAQIFLASLFPSNALAQDFTKNSNKIRILTTIKPITILVYAIAKNKAEIKQLIPDFASIHDYSFKPSDLRKIDQAEVIFRIDEHMEAMLNPVFDLLPKAIPLISLAEEGNILLLPRASKGSQPKEHNHGHEHGNTDLHIWTSPQNAIIMAQEIASVLSKIDPKNATHYKNNFHTLKLKIAKTAANIGQKFIAVKNKKYVVFHNSWQYFQKSFGLPKPIVIALHESITPGVKSIRETRNKVQRVKPSCVFADPHVSDARVRTLVEGFDINNANIDVLASGYFVDEDAYINWLKSMEQTILGCL